MPIQYRTFYVRKLMNMKEKERIDIEKMSSGTSSQSSNDIIRGPQVNR